MKRLYLLSRHIPSLSSSSSSWYLSRPLHVASSSDNCSSLPSPSFSFSITTRRRRRGEEGRALSSPHTPTVDFFSSSLLSAQHLSETGEREKVSFFSSPSVLGEDQEVDTSPIQSSHLSPKIRKSRFARKHSFVEQEEEEEERRSIGEGRDSHLSRCFALSKKQDGFSLRQEQKKRNEDSFPSSLRLSSFSLSLLRDREFSFSSLLHLYHIHTSSSCTSPCLIKPPSSLHLSSSSFSSPFLLLSSSPLFNPPPISLSLSSSLSLYRHFSSSPSSPPRSSSSSPPSHGARRARGLLPSARLSFSNEEEVVEREARKRWAVICACMYFLLMSIAFAFVPLYEAFCQATGYGGEVQIRKPGEKKATKKQSTERKAREEQEDEEEEDDDEREEGGIPMRERTGAEDEGKRKKKKKIKINRKENKRKDTLFSLHGKISPQEPASLLRHFYD